MNGMNEHEQGNYFPCDRTRKTFRYRIFEVEKYPRMVGLLPNGKIVVFATQK